MATAKSGHGVLGEEKAATRALSLINNVNGRLEPRVTFIHYPLEGQGALRHQRVGLQERKKRNTHPQTPDRLPHTLASRCFPLHPHTYAQTPSPPHSSLTLPHLQTLPDRPQAPGRNHLHTLKPMLAHLQTPRGTAFSPMEPHHPRSHLYTPKPMLTHLQTPRGTLFSPRDPHHPRSHFHTPIRHTLPLRTPMYDLTTATHTQARPSIRTPFPGKHPSLPVPK